MTALVLPTNGRRGEVKRKFLITYGIQGLAKMGGCCDETIERAFQGAQLGEDQSLGHHVDARELQCAAAIFLLTSDYEGKRNVILMKAMAANVRCVTTKVGAVGDIIEQGASGFFAEPDVDNLARYVVRLAVDADTRHAMEARAQATIERTYQFARQLWTLRQ